jgi:hypothetical protein
MLKNRIKKLLSQIDEKIESIENTLTEIKETKSEIESLLEDENVELTETPQPAPESFFNESGVIDLDLIEITPSSIEEEEERKKLEEEGMRVVDRISHIVENYEFVSEMVRDEAEKLALSLNPMIYTDADKIHPKLVMLREKFPPVNAIEEVEQSDEPAPVEQSTIAWKDTDIGKEVIQTIHKIARVTDATDIAERIIASKNVRKLREEWRPLFQAKREKMYRTKFDKIFKSEKDNIKEYFEANPIQPQPKLTDATDTPIEVKRELNEGVIEHDAPTKSISTKGDEIIIPESPITLGSGNVLFADTVREFKRIWDNESHGFETPLQLAEHLGTAKTVRTFMRDYNISHSIFSLFVGQRVALYEYIKLG